LLTWMVWKSRVIILVSAVCAGIAEVDDDL